MCLLLFRTLYLPIQGNNSFEFLRKLITNQRLLNEKNIYNLPANGSATFLCTDRNRWHNDGKK